jgi:hypothetical protein
MLIAASLIAAVNVLLGIVSLVTRQKRKCWEQENAVYLPFFLAAFGFACGTFLSIPTVICAMDGGGIFAFFGTVVLACDSMMVAYLNCVIRYDDKGFVAKNIFGIKRECGYGEVEGIRSGRDRRIYFRGHSIRIDEMSRGGDEFVEALDKGYKRTTGKWLPTSTSFNRKWDPMNGHLENPWFYFILWLFLGFACAALPVLVLFGMISETDPSEIVIHDVQFCFYEVDGGSLLLYAEGEEKPYEIGYFQHYGEALPAPEALCSGEKYSVGVVGNHRYVKCLTGSDGTKYITLETERQVYRDSQRIAFWILCLVAPIGVYSCYLGIAVARNPERYSKKVRRLFYKDGYLH